MAAAPANLTDASLPAFVAHTELPVLVDFWAEWCGPCKMMAPHFANAASQLVDVRFAKLDTEAITQHLHGRVAAWLEQHRGEYVEALSTCERAVQALRETVPGGVAMAQAHLAL